MSLSLVATLMGVRAALSVARVNALTRDSAAIVRVLLFPEIIGAAILWIAMWYFWFGFDRSHYLKKAGWFVALFFLAPLGPVFYYFFAFRRYVVQAEVSPVGPVPMEGSSLS
ncbi:MAG: hypothetical protein ACRD3B_15470 [Candidatus Sulfotelmatobacter sp.]